jgi:hypothetical protein
LYYPTFEGINCFVFETSRFGHQIFLIDIAYSSQHCKTLGQILYNLLCNGILHIKHL